MRYLAGFAAVAALALASPAQLAARQVIVSTRAAAQAQISIVGEGLNRAQAQITGRVLNPGGSPMANAGVRARDLLTGQAGGSTSTGATGQFALVVNPGSYLLEVVDAGGQIIATSPFISAAGGSTVGAMTITATTGALSALPTSAGLLSTLTSTAARSVTYAAAAAGVAGVVTSAEVLTASPSR